MAIANIYVYLRRMILKDEKLKNLKYRRLVSKVKNEINCRIFDILLIFKAFLFLFRMIFLYYAMNECNNIEYNKLKKKISNSNLISK